MMSHSESIPPPDRGAVDFPKGSSLWPGENSDFPADAPALAMASDTTFADETLVATGLGLANAHLVIWDGKKQHEVEPTHATDDRLMAVLPSEIERGALLIWPTRDGVKGRPFRINAPVVWWSRVEGSILRVFGRNLSLSESPSRVWLDGVSFQGWVDVLSASEWQLTARLQEDLPPGDYKFQCHNGTGSEWGWSAPAILKIPQPNAAVSTEIINPGDWGAVADGKTDCANALQACIDSASQRGGTIRLAAGTYRISRPLRIPASRFPVQLLGAGAGTHHWTREEDRHVIEGVHTILTGPADAAPLPELLHVEAVGSRLEGISFINGVDGACQRCVTVAAARVEVRRCMFITPDAMPKVVPEMRVPHSIESAALHLEASDSSFIVVEDCEFHHLGIGIQIGRRDASGAPVFTNDVRISGCRFSGYFPGLYCMGEKVPIFFSGFRCISVVTMAGKRVIVENNTMRGADRTHGRTLNRMFLSVNSANRHLFVSGNRGTDVGHHASLGPGLDENMGEQLMFHFRYPDGGIFRVNEADAGSVTLDLADPSLRGEVTSKNFDGNTLFIAVTTPLGSKVPEDVGCNHHWMVLVCDGRGLGQFRIVTGIERSEHGARLLLDSPWLVAPDSGSRIVLQACYHQNHVVGNHVDTGGVDAEHKSHGTLFWFNSIENIVADNEYRNLSGGVIWNHGYRNPTAWNLTTHNTFAHIHGYSGDTSLTPACWVNHYRAFQRWPEPGERVAYSIGEICRHNRGEVVDTAAYLHTRFENWQAPEQNYVPHDKGGIILGVVEHCRFREARQGIVLSSPANGVLLRANRIETLDAQSPPVLDEATGMPHTGELWLSAILSG